MTTKTVTLEIPVTLLGAHISEVHVKEPTGLQYLRLGDPRLAVSLGEGGYWIEQPKVIQDYLDHVLDYGDGRTKDQGGAVIALLSFADVRAIKAALFDFFRVRRRLQSSCR